MKQKEIAPRDVLQTVYTKDGVVLVFKDNLDTEAVILTDSVMRQLSVVTHYNVSLSTTGGDFSARTYCE